MEAGEEDPLSGLSASWENLPLSEICLDLVVASPIILCKSYDLKTTVLHFTHLGEIISKTARIQNGFIYTDVTSVEITGNCKRFLQA